LQGANTPESKEKLGQIYLNTCPAEGKTYTEAINKLKDFHIKAAKSIVGNAESDATHTNQIISLISLVGLFVGLSVGFVFASVISKSILAIAERLSHNASEVTNSSEKIAGSSQSLSQSTTEQAASLQETAASLEEITTMINKASEGAISTATSSKTSQDKAESGRDAVEKMLRSMEEISQSNESILAQINDSNTKMNEIVTVIQEIGTKTKVINEIVFQTKLLSFNASVEAARAGEHGKGFAVVAEEVGSLAQMSGNAAKEITDLLESSVLKVESIVKETKSKVEVLIADGKEKVDSGVSTARDCSEALNDLAKDLMSVLQGQKEKVTFTPKIKSKGPSKVAKTPRKPVSKRKEVEKVSEDFVSRDNSGFDNAA